MGFKLFLLLEKFLMFLPKSWRKAFFSSLASIAYYASPRSRRIVRQNLNFAFDKKMSEEEIINLIFLPGFSTKEQATEISGRGVGTDAVLAAVNEFGGNISVQSQLGIGSTFIVVLPLTLAIQKILLTQVGELTVGIPADMISEIVKIQSSEISKFNELKVIHHRDKVIEIKYANEILNLEKTEEDSELTLLIDNFQEKAFVVDKVISTIDTVIKPAPDIIQNIKEISGVTILGDGSIVYIIDIMN